MSADIISVPHRSWPPSDWLGTNLLYNMLQPQLFDRFSLNSSASDQYVKVKLSVFLLLHWALVFEFGYLGFESQSGRLNGGVRLSLLDSYFCFHFYLNTELKTFLTLLRRKFNSNICRRIPSLDLVVTSDLFFMFITKTFIIWEQWAEDHQNQIFLWEVKQQTLFTVL